MAIYDQRGASHHRATGVDRRQEDADKTAPGHREPARQPFDGEPHYGEHGGGERRGHGYGGQAQYGDLSYESPGYDPPAFGGNYGSQTGNHGVQRDYGGDLRRG